MATVNKDFKVKNGLVVEGTTGTINGNNILTETSGDSYILGLVGGSGTPDNTPDTIVQRDANGAFAAGTVTVTDINIGTIGHIWDDGDLMISNVDGNDVILQGEDIRLNAQDDVRLNAGTNGDVFINVNTGIIALTGPSIYAGENLNYTDAERVATQGYVDDAITNIDLTFNSDEITEGTTNLYYTDARVDSHLSGGNAITYSAGTISVDLNENGGLTNPNDALSIDRTTVDTWYDASGAAADVATDLSDHISDTSTHGVTGSIVGTSDVQSLSNKTIDDALHFGYDNSNPSSIQGEVDGAGDLTVTAGSDLNLTATAGDIILNADGAAYVGSATAGNEVATHSYVDNAVSGLAWKQAVNLRVDYNINVAGNQVGAVFDGHAALTTADAGYRFLVTDQNTASENGLWESFVDGAALYFRRPADADVYTELVGAAVYIMEGTQYGSTSWVQGNHYLTDFTGQNWTQFSGQGSVTAGNGIVVDGLEVSIDTDVVATQSDLSTGLGGKQDTLTAGSNISIDGSNTISVTGLASTDISDFATAAQSAGTGYFDPAGSADTALTGARDYTDTTLNSYTPTVSLETTIDGYGFAYTSEIPSSTDGLTEGTSNLYYTDARANDAIASALNATDYTSFPGGSTNTQVYRNTSTGEIRIYAENGVTDSTTDDLAEGVNNLYFTDERAVDAIGGSNIQPLSIDINTYRKEEATQQVVASASTVTAHTFTGNKSVKYLVRTVGLVSGTLHSQITELLVTVDGANNVAVTEYGTIYTSENPLATATADYDTNTQQFRLRVTTAIAGAEVVAAATIMSWAD